MPTAKPAVFLAALAACGPAVPFDDGGGEVDRTSSDTGSGGRPPGEVGEAEEGAVSEGGEVGVLDEAGEGESGPAQSCGDGIVDQGEACDDGNDVPGDGCERDCTASPGQLLWSQSFDGDGRDDVARAVAVAPDSDVLVAGSLEIGERQDAWLHVFTPDGATQIDQRVDLGDDELATAIAITADGQAFVVGLQPANDRALLLRLDGDVLVEQDGAPTDINAFVALANATSEGFVIVTNAGGFGDITATARRYDPSGATLGDVSQQPNVFVMTAAPAADGGTILGGGSFGGMDMDGSVWLAGLAADATPLWSSETAVNPGEQVRLRGVTVAPDGGIVGVGSRGLGDPNDENSTGWIWWWNANGQLQSEAPLDIGGATTRPNAVVFGTHGLIVGGSTVTIEDGFVVGLTEDGALQWGYTLTGDYGIEDGITALATAPGYGVVAAGWITQRGTSEDAWVGMFTD
jgi:cysteine-rich repeat protein